MKDFTTALRLFVALTILTGLAYPLLTTAIAQGLMPAQANGSLVVQDGEVLGSSLVGRRYSGTGWFHGRDSATSPEPYTAVSLKDGTTAAGANLGPTNPALLERIGARANRLRADHGGATVPTDLATASASGLDPHVSPEAALYQVARVARERGLPEQEVRKIVDAHMEEPLIGLVGTRRVNVFLLNLALQELSAMPRP